MQSCAKVCMNRSGFWLRLLYGTKELKKLGKTTYTKLIRDDNNLMGLTISSRDQTSKDRWESIRLANPALWVVLSTLGT